MIRKPRIPALTLLLAAALSMTGCSVANMVQVKNLKDEMTVLEHRVKTLEQHHRCYHDSTTTSGDSTWTKR